jgi:hypothetical protein
VKGWWKAHATHDRSLHRLTTGYLCLHRAGACSVAPTATYPSSKRRRTNWAIFEALKGKQNYANNPVSFLDAVGRVRAYLCATPAQCSRTPSIMYSLVGNPPLKYPSHKKRPTCSLVQQFRHRSRRNAVSSRRCHTIMHNAWRVDRDSRRSPLIDITVLSLVEFVERITISGGSGRLRCERANLGAQN